MFERGYVDFGCLHNLYLVFLFFVTREKFNLQYRRLYSQPVNQELGLKYDQTVRLSGYFSAKHCPECGLLAMLIRLNRGNTML